MHPSPGWFPDPYAQARFRWWDGHTWTHHIDNTEAEKPRLPAWLSVPVVACGILAAIVVIILAIIQPLAIPLGLVPLLIVGPVLIWVDRVEPEPWSERIHALLWGATVAVIVSLIANSVVAVIFGEAISAVVSAPLFEEVSKAAGIIWAVRRRALDGVTDGLVYAGWTALGFAVVEDFLYFAQSDGAIWQTFVLRALLTPFAHPLFTAWTGLAVGLAVSRKKKLFPYVLWGLALAILTHAAWNGALTWGEQSGDDTIVIVAIGLFVLLFLAAIIATYQIRKAQAARFFELLPFLVERYQVSDNEMVVFKDWRTMLKARKKLPKEQKKSFDQLHRALARLALVHNHPGEVDPVTQKRLEAQLAVARSS